MLEAYSRRNTGLSDGKKSKAGCVHRNIAEMETMVMAPALDWTS